jgi:hypothetical protein
MKKKITLKQGEALIKFSRRVIEAHFSDEEVVKAPKLKILEEERGVFVTLRNYPKDELRGCIGYTEGIMPLKRAIPEISLASAFHDPRFSPIRKSELDSLIVEISILTPPELIQVDDPRDYPKKVKIGEDGLIVGKDFRKGLLLPQVPVERKWKAKEFLSHTCMKAGLTPDCWLDKNVKIYKFSAEIFAEKKPRGEVVRVKL